jgi:hypothetical protein
MGVAALKRQVRRMQRDVARLKVVATDSPLLREFRTDPSRILVRAGMTPDPWQASLLRSSARRILLLASRQIGKSLVAAGLALKTALLEPRALVLVLSRALRQSVELFADKLLPLYEALGRPVPPVREPGKLGMTLANGSRIVCLPGTEATIRSYSGVKLLILDEAARVPDALYRSVRPMLAVSDGQLLALSTPFGKRGWFYEAWIRRGNWHRVEVPATLCPRITPEFLAEEERGMRSPRFFRQEYFLSFEDAEGAVFTHEQIQVALVDGPVLFN